VEWVGSGIVGMMVRWMAGGLLMRMGTQSIISILGLGAKRRGAKRSDALSFHLLLFSLVSYLPLSDFLFYEKGAMRCLIRHLLFL
jgi:hypothetical protein